MRVKAFLFDVMVPVIAFLLGGISMLIGLLALGNSESVRRHDRSRRVTYTSYFDK